MIAEGNGALQPGQRLRLVVQEGMDAGDPLGVVAIHHVGGASAKQDNWTAKLMIGSASSSLPS